MCFVQRLLLYIQDPSAGRLPSMSSLVSVYLGPRFLCSSKAALPLK